MVSTPLKMGKAESVTNFCKKDKNPKTFILGISCAVYAWNASVHPYVPCADVLGKTVLALQNSKKYLYRAATKNKFN